MSIHSNYDTGVKDDFLTNRLNNKKFDKVNKAFIKDFLNRQKALTVKEIVLSRDTTSYASTIFMLARGIVDTAKVRLFFPSKITKASDSTKFIALASVPFATMSVLEKVNYLKQNGFINKEKGIDKTLDLISETGNVFEGVGFIAEGSVLLLERARALLPLAGTLGALSTFIGLVNIVIDVKGIIRTSQSISEIDTELEPLDNALIERCTYKNLSHALNILSTSVSFVAFSLVFFGTSTFLVGVGVVMCTGLGLSLGRMILDSYASNLFFNRITQIAAAAA